MSLKGDSCTHLFTRENEKSTNETLANQLPLIQLNYRIFDRLPENVRSTQIFVKLIGFRDKEDQSNYYCVYS